MPLTLTQSLKAAAKSQIPYALMSLLLATGYLVGMSLWNSYAPTWIWMDVRGVYVENTIYGQIPRVNPDRTISQPFWGTWIVTVYKLNERGEKTFFCNSRGANDYVPGVRPPDDSDLEWWMHNPICSNLVANTPGEFILRTNWHITPVGYREREITVWSNVFTVSAPYLPPPPKFGYMAPDYVRGT